MRGRRPTPPPPSPEVPRNSPKLSHLTPSHKGVGVVLVKLDSFFFLERVRESATMLVDHDFLPSGPRRCLGCTLAPMRRIPHCPHWPTVRVVYVLGPYVY